MDLKRHHSSFLSVRCTYLWLGFIFRMHYIRINNAIEIVCVESVKCRGLYELRSSEIRELLSYMVLYRRMAVAALAVDFFPLNLRLELVCRKRGSIIDS